MNLYEGVAKYYDIEESEYQQEDMDFYIEYAQKCKGNILELGIDFSKMISSFLLKITPPLKVI